MTSSLYFKGTNNSYLTIPNDSRLQFGTGDFTIQWFQYLISDTSAPRIFQQGSYQDSANGNVNNIKLGVSLEGSNSTSRILYYWYPSANNLYSINPSTFLNKWAHIAISRKNNKTRFFVNGILVYSINSDNTNFNYSGTIPLCIGNESTATASGAYGGYIYGFCWIKGDSLYSSDASFTVPTSLPTNNANAMLILTGGSFSGTLGNTVINNNVETVNIVPPSFSNSKISMISTYLNTNKVLESQKRKQFGSTSDTSHRAKIMATKTNNLNTIKSINNVTAATIATAAPNSAVFTSKNATEKKSATTAIRRVRSGGSTVPNKVTKAYLI